MSDADDRLDRLANQLHGEPNLVRSEKHIFELERETTKDTK